MSLDAAILLAFVALCIGVALGGLLPRRPPPAEPDEPRVEPPRAGLAVVRQDLRADAESIAEAVLEGTASAGDEVVAARVADGLAVFGAEQWSRGLAEVRDALCDGTGLEPDLAEDLANQAIRVVETRRGLTG